MIGKELKTLIKQGDIKVKELSQDIGVSLNTVYNWSNDISDPDIKSLRLIKQNYRQKTGKNINLDWLISGEGEMFIKENATEVSDELKEFVKKEVTSLLDEYGLTDVIK